MLRKRDSSTLNAMLREKKIHATEYFGEVVEKMSTLRKVLEQTETDHAMKPKYPSFDGDSRVIDFVLVYDKTSRRPSKEKVNAFLKHLVAEGFSTEGGESDVYEHLIFIRIHCNRNKLVKAGIILDMNLEFLSERNETVDDDVFFNFKFLFNDVTKPKERSDVSQRAMEATFNRKPKDITQTERIMITHELLKNTRYGPADDEIGIMSLFHKGFLHTCYPLHDGPWEWSEEGPLNDRQVLMQYWASPSNWYKLQPINLVRRYFGPEVAFYFAFLGFFNKMLIIPSCAGIITIFYGLLTYIDSRNYPSQEICKSNITICPPCHDMSICYYERLDNECYTSKIAYILDNISTAVYSVFWCFWSTIFYAKWKRLEAVLMFRWNLMDIENEVNIRPAYLERAMRQNDLRHKEENGTNYIDLTVDHTQREARYLRILRYCASGITITILVLCIFLVIYLAVVVRWWVGKWIGRFDGQFSFQWKILLVTTVGNLFVILFVCIAEDLFRPLTHLVTDFENHRTQEEFEQAYVYKYAVLCFITSYSFLCYTAFLKGRFFSYPGHEMQYTLLGILNYDLEKIHTSMMSVSYQWTMMTFGKETWRLITLQARPWWRRYQNTRDFKQKTSQIWEKEYQLHSHDYPYMAEENMKVILQYGYLVLFPGANPFGPLCYFLFNLWSLRFDAKRTLVHTRRVIPVRSAGFGPFGPWLKLILMLTILGMGTNVFCIAFTSNFVPGMCHWFNPYYTNFVDYTFSQFALDDYPLEFGEEIRKGNVGNTSICYYKGNRFPPTSPKKYFNTIQHWNLVAVRFLAVLLIQSFVIIFCGLLLFAMSTTPHYIKESLRHREQMKEKQRDEKFRRDKAKTSTGNADLRKDFTVIGY